MSCVIIYKGRKYSEEQFKEYFINNKQEFVTSIAKNKYVIDSFKRKMEAIDGVFKDSPELAKQRIKAQIARGENRANVPDSTIDRHAESYKQMLEDIKSEPISNFEKNIREEIITDLLANYSYTIEINTAKEKTEIINVNSEVDELIAQGYTYQEALDELAMNFIKIM